MIIGIDGNEANIKEKVGVHQYAFKILWGLYKLQDIKKGTLSFIIYLKNVPSEDLPPENTNWKYKVIKGNRLWIFSKLMPELLKTLKPDVLFSPHHYLPLLTGCPSVCVIHDLGYLNFSGQFRKKDYWQLSIWSAISVIISKYIICPSESVRKDIVRHYSFAKKKVLVIPHGYDSDLFNASISEKNVRRVVKKYRIGENYILFLSTLKPSKNIEGLIVAYSTIRKRYDYKLVIAGKKGWMYQSVFKKVKDLGLENDVVFTDYVPEEDKPGLIKGARVFTLPSYWEGFGMDILNAKACGVPVVVSNRGSLPEVAGSAGIYVEPTNIDSIANGITSVLEMTEVDYNRLSLKCIQEAKKYSWEKAANQTLSAIIDAVNKEN